MARKAKTFAERLQAAKDMIALYKYTQEVRGALALLPEFAVEESGMKIAFTMPPGFCSKRSSFRVDLKREWITVRFLMLPTSICPSG